jgi:BirA family biotin operon repressor/biotin-[acetyl-CoA-carboxylase] ligase
LINNIISGKIFETSVAGVGLNVNQHKFSIEIPNPVSINQILNKEIELKPALINLCKSLETRYIQLQNGEIKKLYDDYCNNLLGYNRWRDYLIGEKQISGKITGVTETGRLMVQTEEKQLQEFDHHQIEFLF